jgi:serine racemase
VTICDGLEARLGSLTWPVVRQLVDGVLTVSEEEVVAAMRLTFERLKVVVEPSGAAGLAAALGKQLRQRHPHLRHVGVVLCGEAQLAGPCSCPLPSAAARSLLHGQGGCPGVARPLLACRWQY